MSHTSSEESAFDSFIHILQSPELFWNLTKGAIIRPRGEKDTGALLDALFTKILLKIDFENLTCDQKTTLLNKITIVLAGSDDYGFNYCNEFFLQEAERLEKLDNQLRMERRNYLSDHKKNVEFENKIIENKLLMLAFQENCGMYKFAVNSMASVLKMVADRIHKEGFGAENQSTNDLDPKYESPHFSENSNATSDVEAAQSKFFLIFILQFILAIPMAIFTLFKSQSSTATEDLSSPNPSS